MKGTVLFRVLFPVVFSSAIMSPATAVVAGVSGMGEYVPLRLGRA